MGLMSRSARGATRSSPRTRETRNTGAPVNRNRWNEPKKTRVPLSFRWVGRVLAWMGTLGLCLAVVGGISIGLLYGYRFLTNSPYFALKNLEISGNLRLTSREVLDMAGLHNGMNSLLISIDDVERKLIANSWIKDVSVRRSLPDGITIRLEEREPRFWVRHNNELYYADMQGGLIVPVSVGRFAPFPTLEVEAGAEDLMARLPELLASLASSRMAVDVASLSRVRLSPGRGVEVFLESDRLILSIGQEEWSENLARLAATLADLIRRGELAGAREVRAHGSRVWVIKKSPVV